jgi:hypothetical protein
MNQARRAANFDMSSNSNLKVLIGDPARQAPDLHKGLIYQIWRSVEAWINLADDELLFLEGAEDYDVVSSTSGTAVQVKATVGNITLRSEAVISALNSFWLIKNNHQDKQIWLRFITTSSITTEQGQRFAKTSGSRLHELTFLADEAFVRWKLGEKGPAVTELANVVRRLETLDANEDDFQFHRAWKSIEQVIKWCRQDSGEIPDAETYEPPVGFCSKPEGNEKLRDIPKAPIDFLWLFLAQIEFRLGLGRSIFDVAMKRLASRILLQARFAVPSFRMPPETVQQLELLARVL